MFFGRFFKPFGIFSTEITPNKLDVTTPHCPQRCHDILIISVIKRKFLSFKRIALTIILHARHVPLTRNTVKRMRRRSQAQILLAFPINGVMLRIVSRSREIAYLIMLKSLIFSHFDKNFVLSYHCLIINRSRNTFINTLSQCRFFLNRQSIRRQMIETRREEDFKIFAPFFIRQRWDSINQIKRNFLKTSVFCPFQDLQSMLRVVFPAQILQIVIEKTLNTYT